MYQNGSKYSGSWVEDRRTGDGKFWVKVKGHSGDVVNDKADAWATDGRDGTSTPRELEMGAVLAQHS